MKHLTPFLFLFFTFTVQAQQSKPPVNKTIYSDYFSPGDRIDLGEILLTNPESRKNIAAFADSLRPVIDFIRRNTNLTFRINVYWDKKYRDRPQEVAEIDTLLVTVLNDYGYGSIRRVSQVQNHFLKKPNVKVRAGLEITGAKIVNRSLATSSAFGTIGLPEYNMLYRNYDNILEFAVTGASDTVWLKGDGVNLNRDEMRKCYIGRITGTGRTVTIGMYTFSGKDTVSLGVFKYYVSNLPNPMALLGTIPLEEINSCDEAAFLAATQVSFTNHPGDLLQQKVSISSMAIKLEGKRYLTAGNELPPEFKAAYAEAPQGIEIVFALKIKVHGSDSIGEKRALSLGPYTRIKQSPKGTKYP